MQRISLILLWASGLMTVLALYAGLSAGVRFAIGPVRISASQPSRLLLEGAVLLLFAALAAPRRSRTALSISMAALVIAAVLDSAPRRVGDGAEYAAMALNLSQGRSPALTADELYARTKELRAAAGFQDAELEQPLVGSNSRQDFYHFWLYPLLVAPFMAVTQRLGVHPNHAFTAVNCLLIALLAGWMIRRDQAVAASLIVVGPILWWVDKAHAEIFLFVTLAFSALLVETWPAASILAASLAAAQNPGAVAVLLPLAIAALLASRINRPPAAVFLMAAGIAVIPPAYYLWHLKVWSPLAGTTGQTVPGLHAVVTPLIDPNLGLFVYAPALSALALIGLPMQSRRWILAVGAAMLLLFAIFSMSANVNHGGTPGMSRYGLWILALAVPAIIDAVARLESRRPVVLAVICAGSIAASTWTFRPALADRLGIGPTPLASALWTKWPGLDNPLPEVFAERLSGVDGRTPVPVATDNCEKILIRGDGNDTWWPFPCTPRQAPAMCTRADALCYVNATAYRIVPSQATTPIEPLTRTAWTTRATSRLEPLLAVTGANPRRVRLGDASVRVTGGQSVTLTYIVEGCCGAVAWVSPVTSAQRPSIAVQLRRDSSIELLDSDTMEPVAGAVEVPAGVHAVELQGTRPQLVLIKDSP